MIPEDVQEQIKFPDQKPAFGRFIKDDAGNLWIRCFTDCGNEGNPEGKSLSQINISFNPYYFRNGKIYTIERTQDDIPLLHRSANRWSE